MTWEDPDSRAMTAVAGCGTSVYFALAAGALLIVACCVRSASRRVLK